MGLVIEFRLEPVTGAAGAVPGSIRGFGQGIAPLNHEPRNNPVKSGSIVKAAFSQLNEIIHMVGGGLGKKNDGDIAEPGVKDRLSGLHGFDFFGGEGFVSRRFGKPRRHEQEGRQKETDCGRQASVHIPDPRLRLTL